MLSPSKGVAKTARPQQTCLPAGRRAAERLGDEDDEDKNDSRRHAHLVWPMNASAGYAKHVPL